MDDGSGLVTMVPAWMLDSVACVGMKLGEPRVSVAALGELHYRLVERGLRKDSSDDRLSFRRSAMSPTYEIVRRPLQVLARTWSSRA